MTLAEKIFRVYNSSKMKKIDVETEQRLIQSLNEVPFTPRCIEDRLRALSRQRFVHRTRLVCGEQLTTALRGCALLGGCLTQPEGKVAIEALQTSL